MMFSNRAAPPYEAPARATSVAGGCPGPTQTFTAPLLVASTAQLRCWRATGGDADPPAAAAAADVAWRMGRREARRRRHLQKLRF